MSAVDYVIFLNGSYGVGKSCVLDRVGDRFAAAERPFALMDVDWFHRSWPPADHDLDNVEIEAANMSAVWANYLAAGPRRLIVAGVIRSVSDRQLYEHALGASLRQIRLEASSAVAAARLRGRERDDRATVRQWHLDRHQELAANIRAVGLDESVIATDDMTPAEVADEVLHRVDRFPAGT